MNGPLFDGRPIEPKPAAKSAKAWRGALGEAFRKGMQRRERVYRGQDFVALEVLVEAQAVDAVGAPLAPAAALAWLESQAVAFREELQSGRIRAAYHTGGDSAEGLATWLRRKAGGVVARAPPNGSSPIMQDADPQHLRELTF